MKNDLELMKKSTLTKEESNELVKNIDTILVSIKGNRQEINRLVFESVSSMTTAEESESQLANKRGLARFVGGITGSNKALQDKINNDRAATQYASQLMLKKLAEQNLLTLDLVTILNNKMNAAVKDTNEELNKIYEWLITFFKKNRSEIFSIENRINKLEQNINLLNWESTISYQLYDEVEYADLDEETKIVCLVRDFFEITKGKWSTSDLLILKSAMSGVGLEPRKKVNYFNVIKSIAYDDTLKNKLLGVEVIPEVADPAYYISTAALKKIDTFSNECHYIVETVNELTRNNNEKSIIEALTAKYLSQEANVDVNTQVEIYDLMIDFLFNLQNLFSYDDSNNKSNGVQDNVKEQDDSTDDGNVGEDNFNKQLMLAEKGEAQAQFIVGICYLKGDGVKQDNITGYDWLKRAAEQNYSRAMVALGTCYENGIGIDKNADLAESWYQKAYDFYWDLAQKGNPEAQVLIGKFFEEGKGGVGKNYDGAEGWYRSALSSGFKEAEIYLKELDIKRNKEQSVEYKSSQNDDEESSYGDSDDESDIGMNAANVAVAFMNPIAGAAFFAIRKLLK